MRCFIKRAGLIVCTVCLMLATDKQPVRAASFFVLDVIQGSPIASTPQATANGVSADGSVVVGSSNAKAFRWTRSSGVVPIGNISSHFGESANAASANGQIIVGSVDFDTDIRSEDHEEAFRWNANEGLVLMGDLPLGHLEYPVSSARGVSADGSVIVGLGHDEDVAFRWTAATGMIPLPSLPGGPNDTEAWAVSADGAIVVGDSERFLGEEEVTEAVYWTAQNEVVPIGDLPGGEFCSWATGVSADGGVIVGYGHDMSGTAAFRWSASTGMVDLGYLKEASPHSHASGVSADGSVVVGQSGLEAFIWDEIHGMRDLKDVLTTDYGLNLTGWTLWEATAVSANGKTIVGMGLMPTDELHAPQWRAWVALIPEPSTLLLGTLGIVLAAIWRTNRVCGTPGYSGIGRDIADV